jgi:5-methylcytosine-specific restriction endonuclease McrA
MSAWKPKYCERCGVAVKRARGGKDAGKYCSKACYFDHVREGKQQFMGRSQVRVVRSNRIGQRGDSKARCARYGIEYDPTLKHKEIFERDSWVCQSCGVKCLQSCKRVDGRLHGLSPTVDHIVPLSHGTKGHTRDNVQCMCWKCNATKKTKASGQMRLCVRV